ncbi:MAG: agmatinase [Marinilabiliales bacterium]
MNFGGISKEFSGYDNSKVVVIPVPFDATSTWIKGADKGPDAIIEASENMELYDIDTDSEVFYQGIHTTDKIETDNVDVLVNKVQERTLKVLNDSKLPVLIGGNHSVSIGSIYAAAGVFKDDLTVVQLDAHSDLRLSYEGSKYNHACVMARAKEKTKIIQIGVRSMCVEEKAQIDYNRIYFANQIKNNTNWLEHFTNQLTSKTYLTIDLDVFDPSIMPSTGTPEPDGLLYSQVMDIVKVIINKSRLIGMDVVELCPNEINKAPDFLASKLIYQILSYYFKNQ